MLATSTLSNANIIQGQKSSKHLFKPDLPWSMCNAHFDSVQLFPHTNTTFELQPNFYITKKKSSLSYLQLTWVIACTSAAVNLQMGNFSNEQILIKLKRGRENLYISVGEI